jgi:hypothetical protein
MTDLRVEVEAEIANLRIRSAVCPDCADFGAVLVALQDKPLWVTVATEDPENLADEFSAWLAHMEDPEWRDIAELAVVIFGAVWWKLPHREATRQCIQFGTSPSWLMDVPLEVAWATRGVTWGRDDITRTLVALACTRAYADAGGVFDRAVADRLRKGRHA